MCFHVSPPNKIIIWNIAVYHLAWIFLLFHHNNPKQTDYQVTQQDVIGGSTTVQSMKLNMPQSLYCRPWASCQIPKIACCTCARKDGKVSPPPWVSDPDMHHGTCMTHVLCCMLGSLTSGFLWSRRHSLYMCNTQFYVSGKRPIQARS